MSFTIENNEIVLKGFEEGIFDDPYKGIYDMRCVDIVSIPGEASIAMKTTPTTMTDPNVITNKSVTCDYATDVLTWDGEGSLVVGQPIYFKSTVAGEKVFNGLNGSSAYYVKEVLSPTTFTVSATPGGTVVDILSGTTAIQTVNSSGSGVGTAATFQIDLSAASFNSKKDRVLVVYFTKTGGADVTTSIPMTQLAFRAEGTKTHVLYYRICDGTETTIDISWTGSVVFKYTYDLWGGIYDYENPVGLNSQTSYTTNDTVLRAGGLTTTVNKSTLFYYGWASGSQTVTAPSSIGGDSWATVTNSTTSGATAGTLVSYNLFKTTAGASGNVDATLSAATTDKRAFLFILNPYIADHVVFSTIDMGIPSELYRGLDSNNEYLYFCVDNHGRLWIYDSDNANLSHSYTWKYLNNLSDNTLTTVNTSVCVWFDYIFVFSEEGVSYTPISTLANMMDTNNWVYLWQPALATGVHKCLISKDDQIFFCNGNYVGRLFENTGFTFDPTDGTTYSFEDNALPILQEDRTTFLAELGSDLLIGGINNLVYPWNMVDPGYGTPIRLSENYISRIVTINTTAYIFAGYKGRIFMTNGGNATPFYKIPEYLSGTPNAYYVWTDATFNNNQLYFTFTATNNNGDAINTLGGIWAINVDSPTPSYPRLQTLLSNGSFSGMPTCLTQYRGTKSSTPPNADGYGLIAGWYDSPDIGIDIGTSDIYTDGDALIEFDPIPVGTFKTKKTFENIEYKLGAPLAAGESVAVYYRTNLSEPFTQIQVTSGGEEGDISGLCDEVTFENVQWIQVKVRLYGTNTSPSYVRLREVRIR